MGQVQAVLSRGLQPVVVTNGQNQNVVEIQDTQSSVPGLEGWLKAHHTCCVSMRPEFSFPV